MVVEFAWIQTFSSRRFTLQPYSVPLDSPTMYVPFVLLNAILILAASKLVF